MSRREVTDSCPCAMIVVPLALIRACAALPCAKMPFACTVFGSCHTWVGLGLGLGLGLGPGLESRLGLRRLRVVSHLRRVANRRAVRHRRPCRPALGRRLGAARARPRAAATAPATPAPLQSAHQLVSPLGVARARAPNSCRESVGRSERVSRRQLQPPLAYRGGVAAREGRE